jgi:S1-C subfamily serine protease
MTRTALAVLVAVGLAGCSALPQGPDPLPSTFIPSVTPSAVASADTASGFTALEREALRVRVRTCTEYGTGSAFAIDKTHAITNRHVAEGATDVTLTGFDGTVYTGTAVVLSRTADLALITIKGTFPNIATLNENEPQLGTILTIAGYPKGEALATREGQYLEDVPDELKSNDDEVYKIDAESHPGNSGSAVANSAGYVVGVLYASDDVHTSYAVTLPALEDFLANLDKAQKNHASCKSQG